ncbi:hypothetical protein CKAN_00263400 [Cinnamomum micranthum f. kanehirae]|uniref:Uncharacterized protein n=1 Tax=Cinnamomum micranthum f. kanehirae TaxID=337451 RepID=A0A3S3PVM7_9MAGN|nr:hypothetical protein CKAN_00263400 [Cinnamomum micranthum f. kanehirae]
MAAKGGFQHYELHFLELRCKSRWHSSNRFNKQGPLVDSLAEEKQRLEDALGASTLRVDQLEALEAICKRGSGRRQNKLRVKEEKRRPRSLGGEPEERPSGGVEAGGRSGSQSQVRERGRFSRMRPPKRPFTTALRCSASVTRRGSRHGVPP